MITIKFMVIWEDALLFRDMVDFLRAAGVDTTLVELKGAMQRIRTIMMMIMQMIMIAVLLLILVLLLLLLLLLPTTATSSNNNRKVQQQGIPG